MIDGDRTVGRTVRGIRIPGPVRDRQRALEARGDLIGVGFRVAFHRAPEIELPIERPVRRRIGTRGQQRRKARGHRMCRVVRDARAPDRDRGAIGIHGVDLGRGHGALQVCRQMLVDGEVRLAERRKALERIRGEPVEETLVDRAPGPDLDTEIVGALVVGGVLRLPRAAVGVEIERIGGADRARRLTREQRVDRSLRRRIGARCVTCLIEEPVTDGARVPPAALVEIAPGVARSVTPRHLDTQEHVPLRFAKVLADGGADAGFGAVTGLRDPRLRIDVQALEIIPQHEVDHAGRGIGAVDR